MDGFENDAANQETSGSTAIADGAGMGSGSKPQKDTLQQSMSSPMKRPPGSEWTN
jgi:hypothetical protein